MGVVSGIVVYVIIWWTVIFTVLPWGVKRDESAPAQPNIKLKFIATSVISGFIWIVVALMIHYRVIDFRQLAASGEY